MDAIFKTPLIFNGEEETVVLMYGNYIISKMTQADADFAIKNIDQRMFDESSFDSIIKVRNVVEYEFEPENDAAIIFGVANGAITSYETIDFKDVETTKNAEKSFGECFKQIGFRREEKQLTALKAAISPGIVTAFVGGLGGIITWLSYSFQDWEPSRTQRVKWFAYLFVKISKSVGYLPFLIITAVLTIICLFWMIKRMANPPLLVKAVKA